MMATAMAVGTVVGILTAIPPQGSARAGADAAPVSCWAVKTGAAQARITWTPRDRDNAGSYVVRRSRNGAGYQWASRPGPGQRAWVDTTMGAGATYTYRVETITRSGIESNARQCGGSIAVAGAAPAPQPPPAPQPGGNAQRHCRTFGTGVLGSVGQGEIRELSGLATSRRNTSVLWGVNDSGDRARVFAMRRNGTDLGWFDLAGASNADWEDLAVAPGPNGQNTLYVGDIGDNARKRQRIVVYRTPEPMISNGRITDVGPTTSIPLRYPNGARDAETLIVDPVRGDIVVITKQQNGRSEVYAASPPFHNGVTKTLYRAGTLDLNSYPGAGAPRATAGDVSRNGALVAIRTYGGVVLFDRNVSQPLWSAFERRGCVAPARTEPQGEAIAIDPDAQGFTTISEGRYQPLNHSG